MTALAALILVAGLFVWFGRLERTGRSVTVVAIVFVIVLLDTVIYQDQNDVPLGLFHPEYRDQSFRLLDILIPAAIVARLLHRPRTPGSPIALLWLAWLAWLLTAGVVGAYEGNSLTLVAYEGKAIIYVGAFLVASGVPLEQYVTGLRLERFLAWMAALALVLIATDLAGVALTVNLPLLALENFGVLGSDAATMFSGLGVIALAMGLLAPERRGRLLAIALVLLATPAFAGQRAAFIALGVAVAIVVVAMALSPRRLRVTPTEAGLATLAIVGLVLLSTVPAVVGNRTVKLPLQDRLTTTFGSYEEVLTTKDRLNQWAAAAPLIAERPVYGHGLGYEYVFWDAGYFFFKRTDLTHNIFADLLLRSGAVGLLLFLLAFVMSSLAVARTWWSQRSDRTAAFALGVGAAVVGLVGKAMAESVFEKYRLAAGLGLGIGVMLAAGLPAAAAARSGQPAPRLRTRGHAGAAKAGGGPQGAPST
jgi:O-antigen ligase